MKTGLESLEIGAPKITYSGNEGPKPPQQMAMADPLLVEEYQKYVFEMKEQGLTPMSFEEFKLQAMSGMAEGGRVPAAFGGIMDSATGRKGYLGGSFKRLTSPIKKIFKTKAISANATTELLSAPLVLQESEVLKVTAATANRLHVVVSALEIKPREVTS